MTDPMDHPDLFARLAAFADGELNVDQSLRVMEQLSEHPEFAARIRHQQHLRQAVKRVMERSGKTTPPALADRLSEMLAPAPPARHRPTRQARSGAMFGLMPWLPTAAAAALLIAAGVIYTRTPPATTTPVPPPITGNASPPPWGSLAAGAGGSSRGIVQTSAGVTLPTELINLFATRHVQCAEDMVEMHPAFHYGHDQGVHLLPVALNGYFARPIDPAQPFDLSALGYRFVQANSCFVPGTGAVHLLYQATPKSGRADSISLWMRPTDGTFSFPSDHLYIATAPDYPHPLVMWKHQDIAYFVVGDKLAQAHAVAKVLAMQ